MLRTALNSLLAVLYPQKCYVCGIAGDANRLPACDACWERTRLLAGRQPDCLKCGEVRDRTDTFQNIDTATCGHCTKHFYDIARSAGVYEYALAASVIRLKTVPKLSQQVHTLLMEAAASLYETAFDVVIPVPLSRQRLHERGFNQAAILASAVASHWRIEIDTLSLRRDQHTPMHRVGMDRKARELSVLKAFSVARPRLIEGRNVLLVDDVFTSGATTSNCAAALKKNGAERVAVLTLARAVL